MIENSCSHLAGLYITTKQYEEADYYFQKEFNKDLRPLPKQLLHLRYGNFQFYEMKCEDKAIYHYMEGVKINRESKPKGKMRDKLRKLALRRLSRDESDPEASRILAFLREDREGQGADKASEGEEDPGNRVPSASLE